MHHIVVLFLILFCFGLCVANEPMDPINFSDVPCPRNVKVQGKIVGGSNALPGEYPWLVSLTRRGYHFCGGFLITRRHVLTAGHCVCNGVDGFIKPTSIRVTVGQHDLTLLRRNALEKALKVITAHPKYKCNKAQNDIAILEFDSDVTWSDNVQPACISPKFVIGEVAEVAGWGWTSENNADSNIKKTTILQKAKVTILENDTCQYWYQTKGKKTQIHHTQLCAGRKEGGVDACWADSGGPLMLADENSYVYIVGIVSTGIGCARPYLPGIYTRLSEFVPWIQSEVAKSNFNG